jgi:polysaccharide export outer membrane protein
MIRILMAILMSALALSAVAQTAAQGATQSGDKLGVGDSVHVTVFQQPDMTTDTRVTDDGMIHVPLVGAVKVDGMTSSEAADAVADALKKGEFLKSPKVNVALTTVRSRQVSVLGLVVRPGLYPLEAASVKMPQIIAAAGGIAAGGSETVTVLRAGKPVKVSSLSKDFELQGGDTVYIDRLPQFYIYGEVIRAGTYPVTDGMNVMQAIALGGGITPRGSESRIKLRRKNKEGKVIEYDVSTVERIYPNDVIYVRESIF